MCERADYLVRKSEKMMPQQTRRQGISERVLITYSQSEHQNIILVDMEQDAFVEMHKVLNSESIFIIEGEYEVGGTTVTDRLTKGDICYFYPGSNHSLTCVRGPGQILVIFAPGRSIKHPKQN